MFILTRVFSFGFADPKISDDVGFLISIVGLQKNKLFIRISYMLEGLYVSEINILKQNKTESTSYCRPYHSYDLAYFLFVIEPFLLHVDWYLCHQPDYYLLVS